MRSVLEKIASSSRLGASVLVRLGLLETIDREPEGPQILSELKNTVITPTLTHPISQPCTASQIDEAPYRYWCNRMELQPFYNRKVWEFCFILQALVATNMMRAHRRGLGFGVGKEPLASVMASEGCAIVATDLEVETARLAGWVATDEHAGMLEDLLYPNIIDERSFRDRVSYRHCDMNNISDDLTDFDFCWSSCAFEHLGTIEKGLDFVEASLRTLKPGGLAVHTTEFNCSSNTDTVREGGTVLFRKRDIEEIAERMRSQGHTIETSFYVGETEVDCYIDAPPYRHDRHLKLALGSFLTTSYGLIVRKSVDRPPMLD